MAGRAAHEIVPPLMLLCEDSSWKPPNICRQWENSISQTSFCMTCCFSNTFADFMDITAYKQRVRNCSQ